MPENPRPVAPFNGSIEIGLRALAVLTAAFPSRYSMQRLVVLDYLIVHSDDLPGGPVGLHPQTPHRGSEILVRRAALQEGLALYHSRGLIDPTYDPTGVFYSATEASAAFLDALDSRYVRELRDRASWLFETFGITPDSELESLVNEGVGRWGAEFATESTLWAEEGG